MKKPFRFSRSIVLGLGRRILKRSSLRRSGMTSSDQASRSEVSDALSMPSLRVCAPTPPGFSQCGLCGASAQDLDLRSCVRLISAGSGASLSALSSPASASLRSVVAAVGFAACTGSCAARTGIHNLLANGDWATTTNRHAACPLRAGRTWLSVRTSHFDLAAPC